ncbi:thiolase [Paucibacter sp. O1-1]|nr:thiolase [Paucibacter sp. O1-1]MDA3825061.1 thiolase [Paucibacter sp. O1-1]
METDNRQLRGRAAIVGIGQFGTGVSPGYTDLELLSEAAYAAVKDAGLKMSDIDGIATCSVSASMWAMGVIEHLGIKPNYIDGTCLGGSSFMSYVLSAVAALTSGRCKAVLVCYGSAQRSSPVNRSVIANARKTLDPQTYEAPYDPLNPLSSYALAARRHMHQYGTTREHLAEVAVAARKWAMLNPDAHARTPLTIEEVLASRLVSDPLSLLDCCLVSDGGGAFVITTSERARDLPKKAAYILGNGTAVWHRNIACMADLTTTAAQESGLKAFAMAGLTPAEVDHVGLYDAFTINPILFLEDLGFCKKGEGGAFVADGGIAPGGRLAVNTNGGGLSCVHPGMYGVFMILEAVRQLRGEAGQRQLSKVDVSLAHGNGGTLSSQSTLILGSAATV